MKIVNVTNHTSNKPVNVLDSYVGKGYVKAHHGSLADVDIDYPSDRRPEIKTYLERRYNHDGKQRVFSAGTFTTEKARSVIKDVARVHKLPVGKVNYITAILEESATWTDLMVTAFENDMVGKFVQQNWQVFEEIYSIMGQPRSAGIHASAVLVVPDVIKDRDVECFDIVPIRKMDGLLVSEIDGYSLDDMGLLKNDCLSIAELSRLSDIINICNREYNADLTLLKILHGDLNDPKVYPIIQKGLTQGVFQMSGDGIVRFIKQMQPDNINDLIALVALFRPGPLDTGSAQAYIDCKRGNTEPQYLWGTYDIVKDTYGQIIYQEQVSKIAQKIGNLSLGDGVNLVKALSKKKIEKVRVFKDKYFEGARQNGCPKEAAERIWDIVEAGASYLFNQSHATAYGLTGYIGAWLKAHYPIAFYTVLLKWIDKEKLPTLMNEMREIGNAKIVQPDINISGIDFVTNYQTNEIYWSLSRIKQIGAAQSKYIYTDRETFGPYKSLEHFIKRIFKKRFADKMCAELKEAEEYGRCPVTVLGVKHLILAGAFDTLENVSSVVERYGLIKQMLDLLKPKETEEILDSQFPEEVRDKHYFWSQKQMDISGFGAIDYRRIFNNCEKPNLKPYKSFAELQQIMVDGNFSASICATIIDIEEKAYKDKRTGDRKKFGKILLQQNTDTMQLFVWDDSWSQCKGKFKDKKGEIIIAVTHLKYSEYDEKNILQLNKGSYVENV